MQPKYRFIVLLIIWFIHLWWIVYFYGDCRLCWCLWLDIYIMYIHILVWIGLGRQGWYRCKLKFASLGKRERLHPGQAKCATFLALSFTSEFTPDHRNFFHWNDQFVYQPLWGCAGDRVLMIVKVHCGTNLPLCWKRVPQNSPTMHFETISTWSPARPQSG